MKPRITKEVQVKMKFIVLSIKGIIMNEMGNRPVHMDSFDTVLYDIFDYKHFSRKLMEATSGVEAMVIAMDFGLKDLLRICDDPKIYNMITDAVGINERIHEIKKYFKHCSKKKKKRDKAIVKEYNFITDLYSKVIKRARKLFGISAKGKAYKTKYTGALSFTGKVPDDFNIFDDDGYVSVLMSDEDDDGFGSIFDTFLEGIGESSGKKKKITKDLSSFLDDEDEEEDDDETYSREDVERLLDKAIKATKRSGKLDDMDDEDEDFPDSSDSNEGILAEIVKGQHMIAASQERLSAAMGMIARFIVDGDDEVPEGVIRVEQPSRVFRTVQESDDDLPINNMVEEIIKQSGGQLTTKQAISILNMTRGGASRTADDGAPRTAEQLMDIMDQADAKTVRAVVTEKVSEVEVSAVPDGEDSAVSEETPQEE